MSTETTAPVPSAEPASPPSPSPEAPRPEVARTEAVRPETSRPASPSRNYSSGRRDSRRDSRRDDRSADSGDGPAMVEKVVFVNRCAKVVKGGRRFSFAALVVVGDRKGNIGVGYGKANEVPDAIKKSTEHAKKRLVHVKLKGDTIPHDVFGEFDGGKVLLKPASPGTGLIAGGGVRAVLEAAGVKNVLTKSMGSNNHIAVVNATVHALLQLRLSADITKLRQS